MAPIPVLIDSDGCEVSCDALWFALTSPRLEVVAVTGEFGVTNAAKSAENFLKVLHAAGRPDVPVAVGVDERVGPAPQIPSPGTVHGDDGIGGCHPERSPLQPTGEPAAELIARVIGEQPNEIVLVSLGPFGNVARALQIAPELAGQTRDLVIMGGAARPPGNATATGEYNVVFDPEAARRLFHARWTRPPLMVGLDVTHDATLGPEEFALLSSATTPQARFMAGPFEAYRPLAAMQTSDKNCPSHDTLATMSVAYPELLEWEELPVTVDTAGGPAWGETIVDFRVLAVRGEELPADIAEIAQRVLYEDMARWRVALRVDVPRFRSRIRAFYRGDL